ncbi:hypothetical protein AAFF_G00196950 [Aldrovandia affinis]|uniref:Laminin EGF-like domain-containing protein n=1 Tax=Aldrovandia affinis TaxID=143900 RepID=A0AAD7RIU4_9TELE|nr:hypothetical protein AAFF_G00196950 [Aldrovandia affinis]
MKYRPVIMFVPSALELVLFLSTIGLSEAAIYVNIKDASPGERRPRAASETNVKPLNSSIPNHLLEGKSGDDTIAGLTPAPTTTGSVAARTAGVKVQPSASVTTAQATTVTSSAVPLKTLYSTTRIRDAATTTKSTLLSTILSLDKTTGQAAVSAVSERTTNGSRKDAVPTLETTTESRQEPLCNCSSEGAVGPEECDEGTVQCACLPGYVGLQCEDCEDGHFSNGSSGCLPCGCDSYGAVDDRCNSSGACVCKPGVFGPKCDDCHPGFFRFSNTGCQPCQCNNHSSYCHPQSGICLDCQGNTKGPSCEECIEGSYRRPGAALTDACTACPCSSITSTGSCYSNSSGSPVCEQCRSEYQGPRCDRCRDGFYSSGSICLPCDCHGNADVATMPRLCHPETGHCLSCANHTAGPHCETCAAGFTGDARTQTCTPIVLPTPEHITTTTTPATTASNHDIAMTTATNSTSQVTVATTTTQALLTSLGGPTDNTTATVSEVSWAQFNVAILAVIIVAVVLLMGAAGGAYSYREYRSRKLNAPFWTIELKEDNISFSSYHDSIPNADASGLLEDHSGEAPPNGQLALSSPRNLYKP